MGRSDEKQDIQLTIEESPYGDQGAVYEGTLAMFNHFRLQLISFRDQPRSAEQRDYLEADIAGYEELLASGSEKNAENFLKFKRDENHQDRFADNLALIKWLKENGKWEEKK